jgi:hypothetical protein
MIVFLAYLYLSLGVASFCLFYTVEGSWEHWRKKWNGEGDFSLAILVAVFSFKEHGRNKIADWIQYVAFFIKLLLDNDVLWYEDCVGYYRCWSPLVIFAAGLHVHLIRHS